MLSRIIGCQAAKACPIRLDDTDLIHCGNFEDLAGKSDLTKRFAIRGNWATT